jgi:hypothetical protein
MDVDLSRILGSKQEIVQNIELGMYGDIIVYLKRGQESKAHVNERDEAVSVIVPRQIRIWLLEIQVVHGIDTIAKVAMGGEMKRHGGGAAKKKDCRHRGRKDTF